MLGKVVRPRFFVVCLWFFVVRRFFCDLSVVRRCFVQLRPSVLFLLERIAKKVIDRLHRRSFHQAAL